MSFQEESIEVLESRYRVEPQSLVFSRLADAYRKKGDTQKAIDICTAGLQQHGSYITARIILGRCFLEQENTQGAIAEFTHVCQIDRRNAVAIKMLADIFAQQERTDKAGDLYRILAKSDPENESLAHLAKTVQGAGTLELFTILNVQPQDFSSAQTGSAPPPSQKKSLHAAMESLGTQIRDSDIEQLVPPADAGAYEVIETVDDMAGDFDSDITGDDITVRMNMMFAEDEPVQARPVEQVWEPTVAAQAPVDLEEPQISGTDISQRIDTLFNEDFSALDLRRAVESAAGAAPADTQYDKFDDSLVSAETIAFDTGELSPAGSDGSPELFVDETPAEQAEARGEAGSPEELVELVEMEESAQEPLQAEPFAQDSFVQGEDALSALSAQQLQGEDVVGRIDELMGEAASPAELFTDMPADTPVAQPHEDSFAAAEEVGGEEELQGHGDAVTMEIDSEDVSLRLDTLFGTANDSVDSDNDNVRNAAQADEPDSTEELLVGGESAYDTLDNDSLLLAAAQEAVGTVGSEETDPTAEISGRDIGQRLDDLFGAVDSALDPDSPFDSSAGDNSAGLMDTYSVEAPLGNEQPQSGQSQCESSGDPLLDDFPSSGVPIDKTISLDLSDVRDLPVSSDNAGPGAADSSALGAALAQAAGADVWGDTLGMDMPVGQFLDQSDQSLSQAGILAEKELLETSALDSTDVLASAGNQVSGQDVADRLDLLLGAEEDIAPGELDSIGLQDQEARIAAADTESLSAHEIGDALAGGGHSGQSLMADIFADTGLDANVDTGGLDSLPQDADGDSEMVQEFYDVAGEGALGGDSPVGNLVGLDTIELDEPLEEMADAGTTEQPWQETPLSDAAPNQEGSTSPLVDFEAPEGAFGPDGGSLYDTVAVPSKNSEIDSGDQERTVTDERAGASLELQAQGDSGPKESMAGLPDVGLESGGLEILDMPEADDGAVLLDMDELSADTIPEDAPEEEEGVGGGFYTVAGDDIAQGENSATDLEGFDTVEVDEAAVEMIDETQADDGDVSLDESVEPGSALEEASRVSSATETEPGKAVFAANETDEPIEMQTTLPQPRPEDVLSGIPDHVLTPTLADIYYQQGQLLLAVHIFRRLVLRDPDNEKIARRLALLEAEIPLEMPAETAAKVSQSIVAPKPAGAVKKTVAKKSVAKKGTAKKSTAKKSPAARKKPAADAPLAGVKIKKKYRERIVKRDKDSDQ